MREAGYQQVKSDYDRDGVIAIIERSLEVNNATDFQALMDNEVSRLIPHEIMLCGFGGVSAKGSYIHNALHKNYPEQYFDELLQPDGRVDSPLMDQWRATLQPVMFQAGRDDARYPAHWVRIFKRYNLRNTIGHGMLDMQGSMGSYIVLTRIPGEVNEHHCYVLKLITPHLHLALVRALTTLTHLCHYAGSIHLLLSQRQLQILQWLHEGKTNWEIARILQLSEKNVAYHVQQIFHKLNVSNRTQAVACAVGLGLLQNTLCALGITMSRTQTS